jgi:alpha 1,2-mannosyltransferase
MKEMESRFNYWAGYDYVFLNEEVGWDDWTDGKRAGADCMQEFSDDFKQRTQALTSAKCHYGLIPNDHWYQPDWCAFPRLTRPSRELRCAGSTRKKHRPRERR